MDGPPTSQGHPPPEPTYKNHASATLHASQLDKFIKKEVSLGAMIGPLDKAPLAPWTQTSPIMTRPKKDSENRRVIVGLSFPLGLSVNDGIAPHCIQNIPYEYCLISITDLTSKVREEGPGCLIWKADLSRACRQLRIDPLHYPLLGIIHKIKTFLDVYLPCGLRSLSLACQRTTNAVAYMMGKRDYFCLAYVDELWPGERLSGSM